MILVRIEFNILLKNPAKYGMLQQVAIPVQEKNAI